MNFIVDNNNKIGKSGESMEDNFKQEKQIITVYNKQDIMNIFKCESDKALRLLKLMFQMNIAIKIGREYYVDEESLKDFLKDFKGKNILI